MRPGEELQNSQHQAERDQTYRDLTDQLQGEHCRLVEDGRADRDSANASGDGKLGDTHSGEVGVTPSGEAVCGDASAGGSGSEGLPAAAGHAGGDADAGFSKTQLKALSGKLHARHVRSRQLGDLDIRYIEGWLAIREANRIFGYGGWSRETASLSLIFAKPEGGRVNACYLARVRVEVAAGVRLVVREGTGVGHALADSAALAHEFAAKAAETDATKRALATFGARFGLELASGRHGRRGGADSRQTPTAAGASTRPPTDAIQENLKPAETQAISDTSELTQLKYK